MMSRTFRAILAAGCVIAGVTTAAAELRLTIAEGRVTLVAMDVTIQQILDEWARVGQTLVVDADKLSGPPVRLRLVDVPESRALATLLRNTSGYLAAPRPVGEAGASRFDRILIFTSSGTAPRLAPPFAAEAAGVPDMTGQPFGSPGFGIPGNPAGAFQPGGVPPAMPGAMGQVVPPPFDPMNPQPLSPLVPPDDATGMPPVQPPAFPGAPPISGQPPAAETPQTAPRPGMVITPPSSGIPPPE